MTIFNIELTDTEQKSFDYVTTSALEWITNAAKNRARQSKEEIISILVKHCNENNIQLSVGEDAQVQQAYDLNLIKTAQQREDESSEGQT